MSKQPKTLFWASYADLMTSLFFIMLMLFVATIVLLNKERSEYKGKYEQSEAEKQQLERINDAIKDLDSTYFVYVDDYKKSKLTIPVKFQEDHWLVSELPMSTQAELEKAGKSLQAYIKKITTDTTKYNGSQFLLIIEGQASKIGGTDHNYYLSYQRAYDLKKFWEKKGITFDALNCEVIIGGSGDGVQSGTGLMREKGNEKLNQRFLIHIIPKPGYIESKKNTQ